MHGLTPFYSENEDEMREIILKKPLTFDEDPPTGPISREVQELCARMLDREPDKRLQG
eukprot:gene3997-6272_t